MNRTEAKEVIKEQLSCREYLEPSPRAGHGMYCCPFCNSGHGDNHTGALQLFDEENNWKCHACGAHGDVLDLIAKTRGVEFYDALKIGADRLGIMLDDLPEPEKRQGKPAAAKKGKHAQKSEHYDYSEYLKSCASRLSDPAAAAYLAGRGISLETAAARGIGFDPLSDPANNPGGAGQSKYPTPRIIIPNRSGENVGYVGRAMDPAAKIQKANASGTIAGIFNLEAVYASTEPHDVVITEGAFDALSFLEAGYPAIALNSKNNAGKLLEMLKQRPAPGVRFLICLDNDGKTEAEVQALDDGLAALQVDHMVLDVAAVCGKAKDPNEALQEDPERFRAALKIELDPAKDSVSHYLEFLIEGEIRRFREAGERTTGFENLDTKAGGLYSGLYLLAAASSLGKTSFMLQIADQMASGGRDVIFFSLEQSRLELVSKLIARRTAQMDATKAVGAIYIRKGNLPPAALDAADALQKDTADRFSLIEGNFDCDVPCIRDYVRNYISRTKRRPVIIIDYIQLIRPDLDANGHVRSGRDGIDSVVTSLKRLSRDLDLTIFAISSINRTNYMTPIDFESLKESGGLEYTADVVWGLQLQCLNADIFNDQKKIKEKRALVNAEKKRNPRKIELVCLKNRFGISNYSCYFDYYPANDLFVPGELSQEYRTEDSENKKNRTSVR